jgi:putative N6-adenine-specific DNA methylase
VGIAIENARNAGVNKVVDIEQRDFYEFEAPLDKAIMITNPPYGDRITTDDLYGLYETIGQRLKQNFVGNDAWIITHRQECFDKIGFRPSTRYALFNGALECEFRKYQIFDGKLKDRREEGLDIKTEEERKHNLKFKPHKKHDDDSDEDERKERDSHYFKSKPYKDERRRKEEERDSKRRSKNDTKESRFEMRKRMFEAADEEEEEIISRHLGKWSDRGYNREDKKKERDNKERKSFNPNFQKRDGKRFGRKPE